MLQLPDFRSIRVSENTLLFTLAVVVGLATGACIYLFRSGFRLAHEWLVLGLGDEGMGKLLAALGLDPRLSLILILAGTGALVGWIMQRFVAPERYTSIAGVMEAVALSGGRLPYWKAPFKAVASVLSLGAGASVGAEDPCVQIGSNLGSFFGQKLRLSEERVRLLVSAGAASAIAAAFNAPIAGVFFALEIILGEFTTRSFGVVILAAVIASGFTHAVRGASPVFEGVAVTMGTPAELPFYALLGVGIAFVALAVLRFMHWQTELWHQHVHLARPVKTALTGVFIGVIGIFAPPILGPGEEFMHQVLAGHAELTVAALIGLTFLKPLMTSISQNGGFVGGIFATALFSGITLGSAFGKLVNQLLPADIASAPSAFAIAGMAGMLAGVVRAPLTAIMLVFEITNDYALILPIMLTTVVCLIIMERLGVPGIEALHLAKQGIRLQQGRDVDLMQGITVAEAMQSPAPCIAETATLLQLRDAYRQHHTRALCVVNAEKRLTGIVTLGDLQRTFEKALADTSFQTDGLTVGDVCTRAVVTCYPDDPVWTAIKVMGARDIGRLPVVHHRNGTLLGILRRSGIMNAYNVAIAKKLQDQHTIEQIRLHTLTGAHVLTYPITHGSPVDHKAIRDVAFPPEVIVASIQRSGKLIVPHGSTVLLPGDTLTIVADPHAEIVLENLFSVRAIPGDTTQPAD